MISNTFIYLANKSVWLFLFILGPVIVFAADQPAPSDAPPDFAPPAGPPPPPPLPIDDFIAPMLIVALLVAFFYMVKVGRTQRS